MSADRKLFSALLLLTGIVAVCALNSSQLEPEKIASSMASQLDVIKSSRLIPPDLFNFEHYMKVFDKHYSNLLEFLARQHLFLKRLFQSFLSFISFKKKQSPTYQSTNEMSDWTDKEIKSMYMPLDKFVQLQAQAYQSDQPQKHPESLARSKRSAELALGAAWNKPSGEVTLASLMARARQPDPAESKRSFVASNNPFYQAPVLLSAGTDDDDDDDDSPDTSLAPDEARTILDQEEGFFSNLIGSYESTAAKIRQLISMANDPSANDLDEPDQVLLDHTGCLFEVKNQRQCGSCYIFSTMALFEWEYCRQTGTRVSFSEQYPLDCGPRAGLQGCAGGRVEQVIDYSRVFGLQLSTNYPYRHKMDDCPYEPSVDPRTMGYLWLPGAQFEQIPMERQDLIEQALELGPLAIGLKTSSSFTFYANGIDDGGQCDGYGHAMVLVGHGRENNHEFWIIRNSHGYSWGLNGYYKLSKRFNCWLAPATRLISQF